MNDPLDKMNYRPVSVSPAVSKIFERIMQKQINNFVISFLSPYLCDYRKCFDTQQALLTLAQNWKKSIANKDFDGAILMDLWYSEVITGNLHAYGFQHDALKLLLRFLSNR